MIPAMVLAGVLWLPSAAADRPAATVIEEAYARNRDGMIAMSKARFDEAIEHFQQAADLVPDYGITRRGLLYTPNFMTGWAYEKLGRSEEACRYFRRFLETAPVQRLEADKADHATEFMQRHCPSMPRPIPEEEYGL
ncbi:MAG: tetratricopeptide repeat protein [Nitrospirota bacterium]